MNQSAATMRPEAFLLGSVRIWMRRVMEANGWSATEWARRAGTSPTNITRVLDPKFEMLPTGETLVKLCFAAGSQPEFVPASLRDDRQPAPFDYETANKALVELVRQMQEGREHWTRLSRDRAS